MFRVMSSSNRRNNCKIDTSNANKCKWVWRTKYHIYLEILTVLANISTKHLNNIYKYITTWTTYEHETDIVWLFVSCYLWYDLEAFVRWLLKCD